MKEVRIKSNTDPWVNSVIIEAIKERDSLLLRHLEDKSNNQLHSQFRTARHRVEQFVKDVNGSYIAEKIDEGQNNPEKLLGF